MRSPSATNRVHLRGYYRSIALVRGRMNGDDGLTDV